MDDNTTTAPHLWTVTPAGRRAYILGIWRASLTPGRLVMVAAGLLLLGCFTWGLGATGLVIAIMTVGSVALATRQRLRKAARLTTLPYPDGFVASATTDEEGLHLRTATGPASYAWTHLQRVRLVGGVAIFTAAKGSAAIPIPLALVPTKVLEKVRS